MKPIVFVFRGLPIRENRRFVYNADTILALSDWLKIWFPTKRKLNIATREPESACQTSAKVLLPCTCARSP
jgi:hypothetical protein